MTCLFKMNVLYKINFIVLCTIQSSVVVLGDRTGWLFFKKYTDGGRTVQEWSDTIYSDTSDLNKYAWDFKHMLNLTGVFRSPLLEEWDNAEFKQLSFILFNADGVEMRRFDFDIENTNAQFDTFVDYLANIPNYSIHSDTEFRLPFTIASNSEPDKFVFSIIDMMNNSVNQEYFILSMNNSMFSNIPEAAYEDCFNGTYDGTWLPVDDVHQCMYYCLALGESDFIKLYTIEGSITITYCQCLDILPSTVSTKCSYNCNPSGRPCGQLVDDYNLPKTVGSSVYKISGSRQAVYDITTMSNISEWVNTTFLPTVNIAYSVNFGEIRYISRIYLESSHPVHYTVAMTTENCETINFVSASYIYHGERIGEPRVFVSDKVIDLSPFPAMCLLVNITDGPLTLDYTISAQYVQGDFVMAYYFGIHGTWEKTECSFTDGMASNQIIRRSDIAIDYENTFTLSDTGGFFSFPKSHLGHITVNFPVTNLGDDYWISSVSVISSHNVTVRGQAVMMSRKCTNQLTGLEMLVVNDVTEIVTLSTTIATFTFNNAYIFTGVDKFCGDRLHFEIKSEPFDQTEVNDQMVVTLSIYGCLLARGSITANSCYETELVNLLDLNLKDNITTSVEPIPDRAYPAVRPSSRSGLALAGMYKPNITLTLSDEYETEVQRVIIKGDGNVQYATLELGSDTNVASANTITHDLTFVPANGQGHMIKIGAFAINNELIPFIIKIQVSMCTNHFGYFHGATTSVNPTTASRTHASTTTPSSGAHASTTTSSSGAHASTTPSSSGAHASTTTSSSGAHVSTTTSSSGAHASTTTSSLGAHASTTTSSSGVHASTTSQSSGAHSSTTTSSSGAHASTTTSSSGAHASAATQSSSSGAHASTTTLSSGAHASTTTSSSGAHTVQLNGGATTTVLTASSSETTPINCCCGPTKVYTQTELDNIVKEFIANLTVPKKSISRFRRLKMSAPDTRTSATLIGTTCGTVVMTLSGAIFIVLDFEFIRGAFNIVLGMLRGA